MTKKDRKVNGPGTVSHEELGRRLETLAGFREAYDQRARIIRLGEMLRQLRESEVRLSQSEAAHLLGMHQSELSRVETGFGERGPSYGTIVRIIETYAELLRERGVEVRLTLEVTSPGEYSSYFLTTFGSERELARSSG